MTHIQTSGLAFYWNKDLADELASFLTKRLKCAEAAAEITQETFLRFHKSTERHPPDNARALAYRIAINLANDYLRKVKVREKFTAYEEPDVLAENHPCGSPGPEQTVMAQQRLLALQGALDELEVDCRTAFLLHSVDGLTHLEIAARLDISRSKVARLIVKALSHLAVRVESER